MGAHWKPASVGLLFALNQNVAAQHFYDEPIPQLSKGFP
jgi:hypothetical protein